MVEDNRRLQLAKLPRMIVDELYVNTLENDSRLRHQIVNLMPRGSERGRITSPMLRMVFFPGQPPVAGNWV